MVSPCSLVLSNLRKLVTSSVRKFWLFGEMVLIWGPRNCDFLFLFPCYFNLSLTCSIAKKFHQTNWLTTTFIKLRKLLQISSTWIQQKKYFLTNWNTHHDFLKIYILWKICQQKFSLNITVLLGYNNFMKGICFPNFCTKQSSVVKGEIITNLLVYMVGS